MLSCRLLSFLWRSSVQFPMNISVGISAYQDVRTWACVHEFMHLSSAFSLKGLSCASLRVLEGKVSWRSFDVQHIDAQPPSLASYNLAFYYRAIRIHRSVSLSLSRSLAWCFFSLYLASTVLSSLFVTLLPSLIFIKDKRRGNKESKIVLSFSPPLLLPSLVVYGRRSLTSFLLF